MDKINNELKNLFDSLLDKMSVFAKQGVQVEGWAKGEILYLFERLQYQKLINGFDREVNISESNKQKCDFKIKTESGIHWIELKFWIMEQKGTLYPPKWYFSQKAFLYNDFQKLFDIPGDEKKWAIVICVANPGKEKWEEGLNSFQKKFMISTKSKLGPEDYPPEYYLALMPVIHTNKTFESKVT